MKESWLRGVWLLPYTNYNKSPCCLKWAHSWNKAPCASSWSRGRFPLLCFPHPAQELPKNRGSNSLLLSLSFIRWERAPAPQLVHTALYSSTVRGCCAPHQSSHRNLGTGTHCSFLQCWGNAVLGEGSLLAAWLSTTAPQHFAREEFCPPQLKEDATNKRSWCEI